MGDRRRAANRGTEVTQRRTWHQLNRSTHTLREGSDPAALVDRAAAGRTLQGSLSPGQAARTGWRAGTMRQV